MSPKTRYDLCFWNSTILSLLTELCINEEALWLPVSQAARFLPSPPLSDSPLPLSTPCLFSGTCQPSGHALGIWLDKGQYKLVNLSRLIISNEVEAIIKKKSSDYQNPRDRRIQCRILLSFKEKQTPTILKWLHKIEKKRILTNFFY